MEIRYDRLLTIDVEASGLHAKSYPIEIGWSDMRLSSTSLFIRRPPTWTDRDWMMEAEEIHGIDRVSLDKVGLPVGEVSDRLSAVVENRVLVSDNPAHDRRWLRRLYDVTDRGEAPEILDLRLLLESIGTERGLHRDTALGANMAVRSLYPRSHRADVDARSMAAAIKAVYEPMFGAQFGIRADNCQPVGP